MISFASSRRSLLARLGFALSLAAGACGFTGCSTMSVQHNMDEVLALAPVPQIVASGQELRAADEAAARIPGAQAFRGLGDSMKPLYASGTAIVVTPCDFAKLRKGMQVLYVNHDGFGVAHVLVGDIPGGWIVQGVNNAREDDDLVTARNLVGVISQVYASTPLPIWSEKGNVRLASARPQANRPGEAGLLASAN